MPLESPNGSVESVVQDGVAETPVVINLLPMLILSHQLMVDQKGLVSISLHFSL